MATRFNRREAARIEAGAKLAILAIVMAALLIGGVSGFVPTLLGLLFLATVAGTTGIGILLLWRSRLFTQKKAGITLILAALLLAWWWSGARGPIPWRQEQATVIAVHGPTVETETDFAFHPHGSENGVSLLITQRAIGGSLSEAKHFRPMPKTVYFDRLHPNDAAFEPHPGWASTSALPFATRVKVLKEGTATMRLGSRFSPRSMTATGPNVTGYTVGQKVRLWVNPSSWSEMSFAPRVTERGDRFGLLFSSLAIAALGIAALTIGKQWILPQPTHPPALTIDNGKNSSIAVRLREIDWFQFEGVAARILEEDGWSVTKSAGAHPDGGADMVATKAGRRAVVQCKHWRKIEVKPNIIRELLGTKNSAQFHADEAMLFTLSPCTEAALRCALENKVGIYDAGAIEMLVARIGVDRFPELLNPEMKRCPKCGAPMVLREKAAIPFWGCSTFPRCRGKFERYPA